MITIYHLETSRSERIVWLMEELGLEYWLEIFPRESNGAAPSPLKAIHALGKAPVIRDGDTVLAESAAIVEYIVNRYGGGRLAVSADDPDYARYLYWLHFAEGSLMPPLLLKLVFDKVREAPVPFFIKPVVRGIADKVTAGFIAPNLTRLLAFMEAELASRAWFAGAEFSAADVQMSYPLEAAAERAGLDSRYPALTDWLARIHARPAYVRALAAGGPYSAVP